MKVHTDYTMSDIATDSALQVGFESSECDTAETAYGLVLHMGGIYGRYLEAEIRLKERIVMFCSSKYEHK